MNLGNNQKIAVVGNLLALSAAYVLVLVDKLAGEAWIAAAVGAVGYIITQGRLANKDKGHSND